MRNVSAIQHKIVSLPELLTLIAGLRLLGKTLAFTNGCFDILHEGHIYSLSQAAKEANVLIVGVNADAGVKKLKGDNRPINNQQARSLILASLVMVDFVTIFEEDTPLELIKAIKPDVLVKGGDYTIPEIAGAAEVIAAGGRVIINPLIEGISTSAILEKINKL